MGSSTRYRSPMHDNGYDISDDDVDPLFGTPADLPDPGSPIDSC